MAKQLNFEYENKEYTLEFTRESIKQMEREGFVAGDIVNKPMNTLPKLFAGAFKAHHRFDTKQKKIDEIPSRNRFSANGTRRRLRRDILPVRLRAGEDKRCH